jgi:hypothetical protein
MKRYSLVAAIVAVGLCFMFAGCAKEPSQEIAAAQAAVDSARAVQADKYLARDFASVQEVLNKTLAEAKKIKSSNPLSRNYDKVRANLASVVEMAVSVREKAVAEKAKVQRELDSEIAKLNSSVAEAKALIKKAPKKAAAMVDAKAKEVSDAAAQAAEILKLKASGDLIAARDAANAAISRVEAVTAELGGEMEKAVPKAKKKK